MLDLTFHQRIVGIAGSVVLLALILYLLVRRKMLESFGVVWFVAAMANLALMLIPPLLRTFAAFLGAKTPTTVVFLMAILLLVGACLHLSAMCSNLRKQVATLAVEIALERGASQPRSSGSAVGEQK
jgi:hypothetical protein